VRFRAPLTSHPPPKKKRSKGRDMIGYLYLRGIDLQALKQEPSWRRPIAESPMTAICFILFDKLKLVNFFLVQNTDI
jgi:hypothetical protein